MKKAIKIISIVAAVSIVAGIIVWLIGMSVIGWDFSRLDGVEYTQKSYEATQPIKKVSVDLDTFPITVKSGEAVSLEYFEATGSTVSVSAGEDGVLEIKEDYRYNPFRIGIFDFSKHNYSYVLTVTDGVEFDFSGTNSSVVFEGMYFQHLAVKSTNTKLTFKNTEVNTLDIVSTNTTLKIDGCTIDSVKIKTTNFDANIVNTKCGTFDVDGTNLTLALKTDEFESVDLRATNIHANAKTISATSLYVKGTNIDCDLLPIKALENLYIDGTNITANINIEGVKSEYNIATRGKKLPASAIGSTDKKITIYGTNNHVDLKFIEA